MSMEVGMDDLGLPRLHAPSRCKKRDSVTITPLAGLDAKDSFFSMLLSPTVDPWEPLLAEDALRPLLAEEFLSLKNFFVGLW